MKSLILFIIISGLLQSSSNVCAQEKVLQNGDLIFQESCSGGVSDAIKGVTSSVEGYNFTHVGIVWIDQKKDTFVIEATHPVVSVTSLQNYLYPKDERDCPPKAVVARLNKQYLSLIPKAINEALKHIGKEYDYAFILDNDKYYCSELIYDIFLKANNNKPVFQLNIMTFKGNGTDEFLPNWVEYYKKINHPIPEGEPGINPGAMSKSDALKIIFEY